MDETSTTVPESLVHEAYISSSILSPAVASPADTTSLDQNTDSNQALSTSGLSQECTKSAMLAANIQIPLPEPTAFASNNTATSSAGAARQPYVASFTTPATPLAAVGNGSSTSTSSVTKFVPHSPANVQYVKLSECLSHITETQLRRAAERRQARILGTDAETADYSTKNPFQSIIEHSQPSNVALPNKSQYDQPVNASSDTDYDADDVDGELARKFAQIDLQLGLAGSTKRTETPTSANVALPPPSIVLSPYRGAPIVTPSRVLLSPLNPLSEAAVEAAVEARSLTHNHRVAPLRNDVYGTRHHGSSAAPDSPRAELARLGPASPHRLHLKALARSAERAGANVVEIDSEPPAPAPYPLTPVTRTERPHLFSTPLLAPSALSTTYYSSNTSTTFEPSPDLHAATLRRLRDLKTQVDQVVLQESHVTSWM